MAAALHIRLDDLSDPRIATFLEEHLADMRRVSPPESVHALDLRGLKQADVSFWTGWIDGRLAACGALKTLTPEHGEIKSMRTSAAFRGQGAGRLMLIHIAEQARARHMQRLSLETGSQDAFLPARALYASFGFVACGPFGDYAHDPHSVFMTLPL